MATGGLDQNWPPPGPVSPGWHLLCGFAEFELIRNQAKGAGVRIAHLDTGYWPAHDSTPRHIHPELGYNFWENNTVTIDPGIAGVLDAGHGTATLALLAGNTVDLFFQGYRFQGDFGGAPDADIVPVRIGPSVVHLYTSSMAQGLDYSLGPSGNPDRPNPANRCDVVSISHGGLPTECWAQAVNSLYDAGVIVVAAAGNNYRLGVPTPTHFVVYPSAFNRVFSALGTTYDKGPYVTYLEGEMEGNWGPDEVMQKAVAAFTPNVAWMKFQTTSGFTMSGKGTSASTPQIAAACALWIQLYGNQFPAGWQRVEACRAALFMSADNSIPNLEYLGRGILKVPALLDPNLVDSIKQKIQAHQIVEAPPDSVSFPLLRLLLGIGPPTNEAEKMYETEADSARPSRHESGARRSLRELSERKHAVLERHIAIATNAQARSSRIRCSAVQAVTFIS